MIPGARTTQAPTFVLFSRLESTLQDPASHSFEALRPGLQMLAKSGIPLIVCAGRTRAELELIRGDLDIGDPFVAENGAAVFVPRGYFPFPLPASGLRAGYHTLELSISHEAVVRSLRRIARQLRIGVLGFSDMSVGEVARECGLTLLQARLAKLREYDEPFRVVDADPAARARLVKALRGAGLEVRSEGRFDHVVGSADLGAAVSLLRSLYGRRGPVVTVAVGSGPADLALLRRVDVPIVIPNGTPRATAPLLRSVPGATVTREPGPAGWLEAVEGLVERKVGGVEGAEGAEGAGRAGGAGA